MRLLLKAVGLLLACHLGVLAFCLLLGAGLLRGEWVRWAMLGFSLVVLPPLSAAVAAPDRRTVFALILGAWSVVVMFSAGPFLGVPAAAALDRGLHALAAPVGGDCCDGPGALIYAVLPGSDDARPACDGVAAEPSGDGPGGPSKRR